jgi:Ca2+-transporting ATPase
MEKSADHAWHQMPVGEVFGCLDVNPSGGLSTAEIHHRRQRFGPIQMTAQKRLSEWMRLLLQFHQPLVYILLAATGITVALGEWVDESVIFGVVFINAIVGYHQETKAEKAIDSLA